MTAFKKPTAYSDAKCEWVSPTYPYDEENAQLKDENRKLRELVKDVMPIVCDGCYERLCEIPKEEHPFVTCSFDDRMRELGVEV